MNARVVRFVVAVLVAVVVLCCAPVGCYAWYAGNGQPFIPSADEFLPAPPGLTAVVEPTDGGSCGSGSCSRTILVTAADGQPPDEVEAEVRRHLAGRGWHLDGDGAACRPAGGRLDRRELCVEVFTHDGVVHVTFSGVRARPA